VPRGFHLGKTEDPEAAPDSPLAAKSPVALRKSSEFSGSDSESKAQVRWLSAGVRRRAAAHLHVRVLPGTPAGNARRSLAADGWSALGHRR
jgi:hypothetical protein